MAFIETKHLTCREWAAANARIQNPSLTYAEIGRQYGCSDSYVAKLHKRLLAGMAQLMTAEHTCAVVRGQHYMAKALAMVEGGATAREAGAACGINGRMVRSHARRNLGIDPELGISPVYIYVLRCPLTQRIRYVGRSVDPKARLTIHLKLPLNDQLRAWFDALKEQGHSPAVEVIDTCQADEAPATEDRWIAHYFAAGSPLFNVRGRP